MNLQKIINVLLICILSTLCFSEDKIREKKISNKEEQHPLLIKKLDRLKINYLKSKLRLENEFDKLIIKLKRKHKYKSNIPKTYQASKLELEEELNKLLENLRKNYFEDREYIINNFKPTPKIKKRKKINKKPRQSRKNKRGRFRSKPVQPLPIK